MCCCCRCVFFLLSFCTWVRDSSSLFIHKFYRTDDQFVHRGRTELTPHTQFKRISFKAAGKINKIFGGFKFGTQRKQQLLLSRERNQLVFVYLLYLFRNSVFFWWLRCVCMYICLFVFSAVSRWQVKVKGKPSNDRPPYFDFSVLRLKSLRMILLSSGIGAIGAYTPLFYLVIKMLRLIILKRDRTPLHPVRPYPRPSAAVTTHTQKK